MLRSGTQRRVLSRYQSGKFTEAGQDVESSHVLLFHLFVLNNEAIGTYTAQRGSDCAKTTFLNYLNFKT